MNDLDSTTNSLYNRQIIILIILCVVIFVVPLLSISTYLYCAKIASFDKAFSMSASAFMIGSNKSNEDLMPLWSIITLYVLGIAFISLIVSIIVLCVQKSTEKKVTKAIFNECLKDILKKGNLEDKQDGK